MSHYSLRWNNHQSHILQAFEALLHSEVLVDVTLVCAESSLRAHKVVLSACSPFFRRIFAEHPCKHPVIVLKDFTGHDVAALIDFMYRGEVRVGHEELPGLIRAAESLQVRGLSDPILTPADPILASADPRMSSPPETPSLLGEPPTPEGARQDSPEEDDNASENTPKELAAVAAATTAALPNPTTTTTFHSTRDHRDSRIPLKLSYQTIREICGSSLMPRRKQARPRRRSGELVQTVPQDLSRNHTQNSSPSPGCLNLSASQQHQQAQQEQPQQPQFHQQQPSGNAQTHHHQHQQRHQEDIAENLSMKRSASPSGLDRHRKTMKTEGSETASSPRCSPLTGSNLLHPDGPIQDVSTAAAVVAAAASVAGLPPISTLSLTSPHHHSEYLTSLGQLAAQWLPGHPQGQLPPPPPPSHLAREGSPHVSVRSHPFQQQQQQRQDSPLPPRRSSVAAMFPTLDGVPGLGAGLFPHASSLERGGSLLADLHADFKASEALHGLFGAGGLSAHHSPLSNKKPKKYRGNGDTPRRWSDPTARGLPMDRPKGQHSAPRGGPPRSWTNAELTEALQQVWNKKMTTSQASRIFGIPYNSLLMYVRGKYGKSLKLEQLRRDCTGSGTSNPEYMNAVNNNVKAVQQSAQLGHGLAALPPTHPADDAASFHHHTLLGGNLPQGFYPDFAAGSFPMPVNMVHLLPPSEQKGFDSSGNPGCGSGGVGAAGAGGGGSSSGGGGSSGNSAGDIATSQSSRTPSPLQDDEQQQQQHHPHHHHHHHESSLQSQSAPALLQHNGSD
ncbi:PREDICTED: protein jim lovell [Dinoponera quadriceps]|uniref:Protein jim lovell n=1 Tax=Dinoponera quadriceps TaxID=609295 RepID=A0A6P3X607_DINQU|nr:PREDICTED: protein jim lovell [Dinoponera quadriceps]